MAMLSVVYRLLQVPVFFIQNVFILLFATLAILFDGLSQACAGYRTMGPLEWVTYTHLDVQKIHLNGLIHSEDDQEMAFVPEEHGDDDEYQSA